MSTIPVRYSPNAERLYLACDEFGQFAAILSDSFNEAYEEALCVMHERDGECDHGGEEPEGCDCSLSDDGYVWAIYLSLARTEITREEFEERHGEDVERIERKMAEVLAA